VQGTKSCQDDTYRKFIPSEERAGNLYKRSAAKLASTQGRIVRKGGRKENDGVLGSPREIGGCGKRIDGLVEGEFVCGGGFAKGRKYQLRFGGRASSAMKNGIERKPATKRGKS